MNSRSNASWSCCPGIKEPAEASRFQGASFCNYFFPGLQTQESTGLRFSSARASTARAHLPHRAGFRVSLM